MGKCDGTQTEKLSVQWLQNGSTARPSWMPCGTSTKPLTQDTATTTKKATLTRWMQQNSGSKGLNVNPLKGENMKQELPLGDVIGTYKGESLVMYTRTTLIAYGDACYAAGMNAIHERMSPTHMGEPVLRDRSCTCHPDDNPTKPCAKRYTLSECKNQDSTAKAHAIYEKWTGGSKT